MRILPLALLIAAIVLIALPAPAQRLPRGGEREEMIRKHLAECEVCAGIQARIVEVEAELAEVERQKEALRLKRLGEQIARLAEAYPEAKEQLEQLLALRKRRAELEKEFRETTNAGRQVIDELELQPEDRSALLESLGPLDRDAGRRPRTVRIVAQRARFVRMREPDPEMARRLEQMEAAEKERLEQLKEEDPETYELTVKAQALARKLADLQADLRDTMLEHLRATQRQD